MADKEKSKPAQSKNIPKDGQVILAILKEMGVTEYEPKTIVQLTEFVYRYGTSILEEARVFANNSKKKFIDLDDVRLALSLSAESTFTQPPPREVLLDCSRNKNNTPLPIVKPHCGLRLPADRYCLSACNYALRGPQKKQNKTSYTIGGTGGGIKLATTKTNVNFIKRTANIGVTKQTVGIPKPITKISATAMQPQKTILKPKIQITQSSSLLTVSNTDGFMPMEIESNIKRKRDDDDIDGFTEVTMN